MGNPDAVSVDPDEVRAHAEKVKTLMESLTLSLEAATYLGSADDGFGAIPRPFVKMVLDDNHTDTIAAIRKLAEDVSVLPDKLELVAETFDEKDGDFGRSLTGLRATIAATNGGAN
ncbi:type VII secretion target [Nocardia sp. NPDC005998]|uniref:type VII secretion target n=1 Tax=Nocardia sp. NPDC005998 TaxID=3156894 RepID=UPI0033A1DF4D